MIRTRKIFQIVAALIIALSAAAAAADTIAYITDTGKKYHNAGCRFLKDSRYEISKSDAEKQGYKPCKVCGG